MGDYKALFGAAKKESELADHLLYVTFLLVKENKFLLPILEHITNAAQKTLQALIEHEYTYKRISLCPTNFAVQISLYREQIEKTHALDPIFFRLLKKLIEIQRFEKDAIVRFKRGDKYILATGEYSQMTVLDVENIKKFLNCTKKFIEKAEPIVMKDD